MFDFVRKHTKIMQFLLFLLIFPSFVLFGIDGYNRFREKGPAAAKVDGQEISQSEWDQAHKNEMDRLRAQMPNLDPKLLDSAEARYATLERLVRDRVLAAAAVQSHLQTSDQRLARELQDNPMISALRRPDGTLDMERYKQLVGRACHPRCSRHRCAANCRPVRSSAASPAAALPRVPWQTPR